jgi:hypothetical protein
MKKLFAGLVALSLFTLSYGQNKEISLTHDQIEIPHRKFYIDTLIDNRTNKEAALPIALKGGLIASLQEYLAYALPKSGKELPIRISVKKFELSEKQRASDAAGYADIVFEYYSGKYLIYSSKQHVEASSENLAQLHEENIREVLKESLIEFNDRGFYPKIEAKGLANASNETASASAKASTSEGAYRNIFAVGYQIGGYSLIGFDYEIRVIDYAGIHFGAGLSGYTYGVMIHTSPKRNSPFFNLSYKDGGFGLLSAAGIEFGGKLVIDKKSNFGLLLQIGAIKPLKVDPDFEKTLFKDRGIPKYMPTIGVGLSW